MLTNHAFVVPTGGSRLGWKIVRINRESHGYCYLETDPFRPPPWHLHPHAFFIGLLLYGHCTPRIRSIFEIKAPPPPLHLHLKTTSTTYFYLTQPRIPQRKPSSLCVPPRLQTPLPQPQSPSPSPHLQQLPPQRRTGCCSQRP